MSFKNQQPFIFICVARWKFWFRSMDEKATRPLKKQLRNMRERMTWKTVTSNFNTRATIDTIELFRPLTALFCSSRFASGDKRRLCAIAERIKTNKWCKLKDERARFHYAMQDATCMQLQSTTTHSHSTMSVQFDLFSYFSVRRS